MKKLFTVITIIIFILCIGTGCSDTTSNNNSTINENPLSATYEMWHPIKNVEEYWIGKINPEGELVEYGIFHNNGYNNYELVVNIGYNDTPHVIANKNNIYYLKSNQLYCFESSNPSLQNELMPQNMKDSEAGYALQSFISIDEDWITLEATKWGINENNDLIHVPTKISISTNGKQWKEII